MMKVSRAPAATAAIRRAQELAREIDALLAVADRTERVSDYSIRIVQGMTRSLVDQLGELEPPLEERAKHLARTLAPAEWSADVDERSTERHIA